MPYAKHMLIISISQWKSGTFVMSKSETKNFKATHGQNNCCLVQSGNYSFISSRAMFKFNPILFGKNKMLSSRVSSNFSHSEESVSKTIEHFITSFETKIATTFLRKFTN